MECCSPWLSCSLPKAICAMHIALGSRDILGPHPLVSSPVLYPALPARCYKYSDSYAEGLSVIDAAKKGTVGYIL